MPEAAKKSLVQKLAEVMGEVQRVAKTGRNEFHRYDYATEADIVASVRGGMAERLVVLVPSIEKIDWTERLDGKGKSVKIATLTVRFTFLDGESDQKIEFVGMGQGEDASDKAIYKAMTGAEKYALLKFFLIPTGDDPEDDTPPQRKATPPKSQPPPSKPSPTAPGSNPAMAIYEKMVVSAREYGVSEAGLRGMIKTLCPEAGSPKELTQAHLGKVQKALAEAQSAKQQVESQLNKPPPSDDPPPPGDDDVPF